MQRRIGARTFDFDAQVAVMAVINRTPDSFYDKGSTFALDKAVSATFILAEEEDFAGFNAEWLRWFPAEQPARQGAKLPIRPKGMKISIAVVAEA